MKEAGHEDDECYTHAHAHARARAHTHTHTYTHKFLSVCRQTGMPVNICWAITTQRDRSVGPRRLHQTVLNDIFNFNLVLNFNEKSSKKL